MYVVASDTAIVDLNQTIILRVSVLTVSRVRPSCKLTCSPSTSSTAYQRLVGKRDFEESVGVLEQSKGEVRYVLQRIVGFESRHIS